MTKVERQVARNLAIVSLFGIATFSLVGLILKAGEVAEERFELDHYQEADYDQLGLFLVEYFYQKGKIPDRQQAISFIKSFPSTRSRDRALLTAQASMRSFWDVSPRGAGMERMLYVSVEGAKGGARYVLPDAPDPAYWTVRVHPETEEIYSDDLNVAKYLASEAADWGGNLVLLKTPSKSLTAGFKVKTGDEIVVTSSRSGKSYVFPREFAGNYRVKVIEPAASASKR